MQALAHLISRAPAWLLFGLALPLYLVTTEAISHLPLCRSGLFYVLGWPYQILCLIWQGAAAISLNDKASPENRRNPTILAVCAAVIVLYFPAFLWLCEEANPTPVPLLLQKPASIYVAFFAARALAEAQARRRLRLDDYLGWVILILLAPLGIWLAQPRVNRLVRNA